MQTEFVIISISWTEATDSSFLTSSQVIMLFLDGDVTQVEFKVLYCDDFGNKIGTTMPTQSCLRANSNAI